MKNKKDNHKIKINQKANRQADLLLSEMPEFCAEYFKGRTIRLSEQSKLAYTYKLRIFLEYLHEEHPMFKDTPIKSMTLEQLNCLKKKDMLGFIEYCIRTKGTSKETADNYVACLSAFWKFFVSEESLDRNICDGIDRVKENKDKAVVIFTKEEKESFMNTVEYGTGLTKRQQAWQKRNQFRDAAIYKLLWNTGIRVSELICLNVSDLNMEEKFISVYRKGTETDYAIVHFSENVASYLYDYLNVREQYLKKGDTPALFLSKTGERLGKRSVELMVRKVSNAALPNKMETVSPHKFRSTCASEILSKTKNLDAVSKRLGHKNVQTSRRYLKSASDTDIQISELLD